MLSETSTKVKLHHNIVSKIPVPQTQKMNHGDDFFHIVSSSIIQFTKAYNETCRETEHMCPFYQLAMGIINHGWRYNWWAHLPFKDVILTAVSPKLTLKAGLHTRFFHGIFAYKGPTKWPSHLNNDNWWTLEHFSIQLEAFKFEHASLGVNEKILWKYWRVCLGKWSSLKLSLCYVGSLRHCYQRCLFACRAGLPCSFLVEGN